MTKEKGGYKLFIVGEALNFTIFFLGVVDCGDIDVSYIFKEISV